MQTAIITPYYKESLETLNKCHQSVLAQKGNTTHFMISDGHPNNEIDTWPSVKHIKIPNSGDYGNTPRGIGAAIASAGHFDAICFLDADNWFDPAHLEIAQAIAEDSNAQIVTTARTIVTDEGRTLGVCKESNGMDFVDTNCYFLTRAAFALCSAWLFNDRSDDIVGDSLFWKAVRASGHSRVHSITPTVNYVSTHAFHYWMFGETPPGDSKIIARRADGEPYQMMSYAQFTEAGLIPDWLRPSR